METVNVTSVLGCFFDDDDHLQELMAPVLQIEPYSIEDIEPVKTIQRRHLQDQSTIPGLTPDQPLPNGTDEDNSLDMVLCLAGALLPQDAKNQISDIINDLLGIATFVFDIMEKGIYIPGELILFVFGWANYNDDEGFSAPFKWYYCMFSVAIFLIAIEIFKLFALRFIVWTKR